MNISFLFEEKVISCRLYHFLKNTASISNLAFFGSYLTATQDLDGGSVLKNLAYSVLISWKSAISAMKTVVLIASVILKPLAPATFLRFIRAYLA